MSTLTYIWYHGECRELNELGHVPNTHLANLYRMRTHMHRVIDKYGYIDPYGKWVHKPLNKMPSEFQMALLLLGVT